jgi:prophage regulatory protein
MDIREVALRTRSDQMSSKLLRLEEVLSRICLSKSSLLRQVTLGRFPRPVRVGERRIAWLEDEIIAWQAARVAARDEADSGKAA